MLKLRFCDGLGRRCRIRRSKHKQGGKMWSRTTRAALGEKWSAGENVGRKVRRPMRNVIDGRLALRHGEDN